MACGYTGRHVGPGPGWLCCVVVHEICRVSDFLQEIAPNSCQLNESARVTVSSAARRGFRYYRPFTANSETLLPVCRWREEGRKEAYLRAPVRGRSDLSIHRSCIYPRHGPEQFLLCPNKRLSKTSFLSLLTFADSSAWCKVSTTRHLGSVPRYRYYEQRPRYFRRTSPVGGHHMAGFKACGETQCEG